MLWFCLTRQRSDGDRARDLMALTGDERARHDRFVRDDDRRDFAAAHALLHRCLSDAFGRPPTRWRLITSPLGKPTVDPTFGGPPVAFNISHTRGLVACALVVGARHDMVGVDVEPVVPLPDRDSLAADHFSAAECRQLAECASPDERFTELWTMKEAYVKAIGAGLSGELSSFGVRYDSPTRLSFSPPAGDRRPWSLAVYGIEPGFRLALAVPRSEHAPPIPAINADAPDHLVWPLRATYHSNGTSD